MGMISKVGRKRWRVRVTLMSITLLLLLGSITMIYPMLLMLAGSTKSNADLGESSLLPGFLVDRHALWRKYAEGLFNESVQLMRSTYNSTAATFEHLPEPRQPNQRLTEEWTAFAQEANLPSVSFTLGHLQTPLSLRVLPSTLREFRRELSTQFKGDLHELNRTMGTQFPDWNSVIVFDPQHLRRSQTPNNLPWNKALDQFMQRQPVQNRIYLSIEGFYREQFLRQQYPQIGTFNAHHGTSYANFAEIRLPRELPGQGYTDAERESWLQFVRTTLNVLWIRATPAAAPAYRDYLRAKYQDIAAYNRNYRTEFDSFEQIPLIDNPPFDGMPFSDWDAFLQGWTDPLTGQLHQIPANALRVHCVDFIFQDHLQRRYGTIARCNQSLGTDFPDFTAVAPPQEDVHLIDFQNRMGSIRWEYVSRNYITVIDYLLLHGRAVWNTVVYCALAIAGALLVNPLAAYALSRYKPPSTYKLLLAMMLTMAFPPMVTQIPLFLLMRDLGMLNTFWALILPGLANGYSIFLLKGFFDSLPQELYESATLDGAGEVRIFWQITMSLSKPILAVVALSAFTSAYSNFMFALLLCQNPKMWTLMVWLYELQTEAGQGVVLASLTLAALPTLVVFVLCQRQIMRGIVVPVEK